MKNNNSFIKAYTQIPDKQSIRASITSSVIFVNILNYVIFSTYQKNVSNAFTLNPILLNTLIGLVFIFDLFSLIYYVFPKQLDKLIFLYTAIAFTGTSFFCLFISSLVFLESPMSYLIIVINLLIYILIIIGVIFNIRNKFKNGYTNKKPLNKALVGMITSLCIAIGMILARQTQSNDVIFAILILIMACILILPCSGFHKFYLIIKKNGTCY